MHELVEAQSAKGDGKRVGESLHSHAVHLINL